MLRQIVEKEIGKVTNKEWRDACLIAEQDIRVNRVLFRRKTSLKHLLEVLKASIKLVRNVPLAI